MFDSLMRLIATIAKLLFTVGAKLLSSRVSLKHNSQTSSFTETVANFPILPVKKLLDNLDLHPEKQIHSYKIILQAIHSITVSETIFTFDFIRK